MDPDACLARFRNAVNLGDIDEASDAGSDLTTWLNSGGFLPAGYRTAGGVLSDLRRGLATMLVSPAR